MFSHAFSEVVARDSFLHSTSMSAGQRQPHLREGPTLFGGFEVICLF